MALQSSGSISLSDIAAEFGGTPPHSMSEYFGQGNAPGNGNAIGLGLHFYGTSNRVVINLTISANTNNYNIWNSKGGSYAAGNTDVILTINSGVAVGSAGINSYALDTGTGWNANDTITIINNGTIIGKGGNGGNGGTLWYGTKAGQKSATFESSTAAGAGQRGGHALRLQKATSIQNNYRIQAGGGGGGGTTAHNYLGGTVTYHMSGHGGGGGAGRNVGTGGAKGAWAGGSAYGTYGTDGGNGSLTAGFNSNTRPHIPPGNGGAPGAAGTAGNNGNMGPNTAGGAGGGRGNYITGNSYVTWTATGTRSGLAA